MTDEQIEALFHWLECQAYIGEPGTDGEYLRMEEMRKYLPAVIKKLAGNTDASNQLAFSDQFQHQRTNTGKSAFD